MLLKLFVNHDRGLNFFNIFRKLPSDDVPSSLLQLFSMMLGVIGLMMRVCCVTLKNVVRYFEEGDVVP